MGVFVLESFKHSIMVIGQGLASPYKPICPSFSRTQNALLSALCIIHDNPPFCGDCVLRIQCP
eukprot:jgi/Mesvir1/13024/Mv26288-RA.1